MCFWVFPCDNEVPPFIREYGWKATFLINYQPTLDSKGYSWRLNGVEFCKKKKKFWWNFGGESHLTRNFGHTFHCSDSLSVPHSTVDILTASNCPGRGSLFLRRYSQLQSNRRTKCRVRCRLPPGEVQKGKACTQANCRPLGRSLSRFL